MELLLAGLEEADVAGGVDDVAEVGVAPLGQVELASAAVGRRGWRRWFLEQRGVVGLGGETLRELTIASLLLLSLPTIPLLRLPQRRLLCDQRRGRRCRCLCILQDIQEWIRGDGETSKLV